MLCPLKFSHYEFEGGQECIGSECGMHKLCNVENEITAAEFDALDEHAQALERENEELRKLCGDNDALAAGNGVSEAGVDANDVNADTREELEADAIQLAQNIWHQGMNYANGVREIRHIAWQERDVIDLLDRQAAITKAKCEESLASKNLGVLYEPRNDDTREALENDAITYCDHFGCTNQRFNEAKLLALLDRQAAITERECLERAAKSDWLGQHLHAVMAENRELQAKLDELTEQLETAHAKNRSLKAHIAKMQEGRHGWHVKGAELQKQVEELTAENAKLSSELTAARNAHAQAEYDAETYRDKLGRMLDNAHEITRIGGDC